MSLCGSPRRPFFVSGLAVSVSRTARPCCFPACGQHSWTKLPAMIIVDRRLFLPCLAFIGICGIHWHLWHSLAFVAFIGICGIHWHLWHSSAFVAFIGICGIHRHLWHSSAFVAFIGIRGIHWHLWHSLAFVAFIGICGIHWHLWHSLAFVAFIGHYGIWHLTFRHSRAKPALYNLCRCLSGLV